MNLTNQYQYPWQVMELLKPVTLPLPSTGEQLSVAAEGEAKTERDILKASMSRPMSRPMLRDVVMAANMR